MVALVGFLTRFPAFSFSTALLLRWLSLTHEMSPAFNVTELPFLSFDFSAPLDLFLSMLFAYP